MHKKQNICIKNQGWNVKYFSGDNFTCVRIKILSLQKSLKMIKTPQRFVESPFTIKLKEICKKSGLTF